MRKLNLIKNQELFQGEKYLKNNKNYFEGWYFKNSSKNGSISFIPGINITNDEKKAFIQVITNENSYFVDYPIEGFIFNHDPFFIQIGNNYFSKDKVHIDIKDDNQNLCVFGNLNYFDGNNINKTVLNPNIMGPFSYVPFMECNHAIIAMKNKIKGFIKINNHKINFKKGIGYIEKDWGHSFPKSYLWCQGNSFSNSSNSFMCSIADIDFKLFHFTGFICVLLIEDKEIKFTTYNNAKVTEYKVDDNTLSITFKKKDYYLNIKAVYNDGYILSAPSKGQMNRNILESISEVITVTLTKNKQVIFSDTSTNCGLEIVK